MTDDAVPETIPDQDVRASDGERDAAVSALAAHYADGRLERAEFDQRADSALAARTRDQLRALFTDLPGPIPVPARASAADAARAADRMTSAAAAARARGRSVVASTPSVALVPLFLVLAVLAVLHGAAPFPLIPLLFILSRRNRRWNREPRPWT